MLRNNNDSKISSIIGPEVEVDGDVKVVGSILIYGKINGSVNATGSVRTARDSHIQGNIESRDANISGNVEGHITVKNKTVLEKGCILNGDLTSSIVVIEEGASFKGLCNMEGIEASKETDEPKDFESSMAESYHEDSIE
tara:strand:+ start:6060 stop:6479 length:420 start_codon:yes stop_codon:yes gene_type:complete